MLNFPQFVRETYNLGQNICGLFDFLAQLVFTTSETKLDYLHQKVNVRVASRVAVRLKTYEKSLKCLDLMVSTQLSTQNSNFDDFC